MSKMVKIDYAVPRPATNGDQDREQGPVSFEAVGWDVGGDSWTVWIAATLTPDGPRGVTKIPRSAILSCIELLGYIPADTIIARIHAES